MKFKKYHDYVNREYTHCDMHGCMTECVICNHPRADGRIAVLVFITLEMLINSKKWRMIETDVYVEILKALVIDEAHYVKKWQCL